MWTNFLINMKNSFLLRFAICLFALSTILTSCSKENKEEIVETVEVIETGMEVTLRGVTTTYDAYAAYCNDNGIESFSVSNNPDLLGNDFWTGSLAEDDFIIHYRKDGTSEFALGGVVLEGELNGQPTYTVSLTDDTSVDITVDEANSTQVLGSMSGDFFDIPDPVTGVLNGVPFSVTFAAEVDSALVPIFCN